MKQTDLFLNRRLFLKQAGLATIAAASNRATLAESLSPASSDKRASKPYYKNLAPLAASAFYPLPLGTIKPSGWLKDQLDIQANGLSGHLDETWADVGQNSGWLGGTGESWERGPYFIDGLIPLAYLLDDARLKIKAQRFIDWSVSNQAPNGMIGPAKNDDWWPRMVMLKALAQYYEATSDPKILSLLSRYFAYQLKTLPTRPLRDWGKFRWQDNALVVIWLFNRTGDKALLELLPLLHAQGYDWVDHFVNFKYVQPLSRELIEENDKQKLGEFGLATHGVNNGQGLKAGPLWSLYSHQVDDASSLRSGLSALDKYHGLPNGMFSCDEHLAGLNPSQGSELCTVVETMYSLEQSFAILGDVVIGDRLERLAFNALPGAFTDDMWAHQYNQEPNQVECSLHHSPWTTDGPESNLYGLEPNFGCCTANFHQGWPKFTSSLWMATDDNGLVAACYAPCELRTEVAGTEVEVSVKTGYPFDGFIRIEINPAAAARFPLLLRIPAWAGGAAVSLNGASQPGVVAKTFFRLDRSWKRGDVVELTLPTDIRMVDGYRQSISVERGPLVFSYPIDPNWVKLRDRGLTADWQVFPSNQWNYAIRASEDEVAKAMVRAKAPGRMPFALKDTPVSIKLPARKVTEWRAVDGAADPVPQSPVSSSEKEETITLVPYAAAKLRITSFPQLTNG